jgi:hypothetical protein
MTFLYTARKTFGPNYEEDGLSWQDYSRWSGLTHTTEIVSLDGLLNKNLVEIDYENPDDWNYIHTLDSCQTDLFTSLDYVLSRTPQKGNFNLLTVVIEPDQDCKNFAVDNFDFVGYDLADKPCFGISALTNCGGFNETFLPTDLNQFGLIDDFLKAYDTQKRLLANNPEEHHADTSVVAIWRHKTIGR